LIVIHRTLQNSLKNFHIELCFYSQITFLRNYTPNFITKEKGTQIAQDNRMYYLEADSFLGKW